MNRQGEVSANAADRDALASAGACTTERMGDMEARMS